MADMGAGVIRDAIRDDPLLHDSATAALSCACASCQGGSSETWNEARKPEDEKEVGGRARGRTAIRDVGFGGDAPGGRTLNRRG